MAYVIAEPCVDVKDKRCVEECPVDAIYEGERMSYIQPDECIDCGACEMVCPVEAISIRMMSRISGGPTSRSTPTFLPSRDRPAERPMSV
jgi:NAD-dependent dihydropyrimidine dehydrogenase PreA subunit